MPPRSRASASTELAPKAPVDFHPTCIVDGNAVLTGTCLISIGAGTIIHPRAKLNSAYGPIAIGENCIISERCLIQPTDTSGIIIGNTVLIECNAVVEANSIGDGTDIEVGVRIGKGAFIGNVSFSPGG